MSESEFFSKLNLLDNIHQMEALIEVDKLEFYSENEWKKINIDLKYLPANLYTSVSINKEMSKLIYTIKYDLLIPHVRLIPSHTEKIVFSADYTKENPYILKYTSTKNEEYENAPYIRYNNENVNIFNNIKQNMIISNYKHKNRNKIHAVAQLLHQNINRQKIKSDVQ